MIPYGRQLIEADDIRAIKKVLKSKWLTTGPKVGEFERVVAEFVGVKFGVAVSSGTAALHAAMYALKISPGDEVIVPPMTFVATANCVVFQGGIPVFSDVDPNTLLLNPNEIEKKITSKTKAIIAVDYAGQPCEYDQLRDIANKYRLKLVADSCHALGARYKERQVGALADLTVFSFHPVKHITTGEGGMVMTDNPDLAQRMRAFRNHGIEDDHHQRTQKGSWYYEMINLGYNYRITDIQCALGISQLRKLPAWLKRRREIAYQYNKAFSDLEDIKPLSIQSDVWHAYHLYVIKINPEIRQKAFNELRSANIGVNVHYVPVHLHPFYRKKFGYGPGLCPVAEEEYNHIISLPIYQSMSDKNIEIVIEKVKRACPVFVKEINAGNGAFYDCSDNPRERRK